VEASDSAGRDDCGGMICGSINQLDMESGARNRLSVCASLLALLMLSCLAVMAEVVPVLQVHSDTYQNVTVVSRTPTHLFIEHTRGVATLKVAELDDGALRSLGLVRSNNVVVASNPAVADGNPAQSREATMAVARRTAIANLAEMFGDMIKDARQMMPVEDAARFGILIAATLAFLLLAYLFYSLCVRLICLKAGYRPGILAWLPILRDYALVRAAGMSGLWFLVLMSPAVILPAVKNRFPGWETVVLGNCVVVLIAHCLWCVRLCEARGKGAFTKVLLIFPLTYPLTFLYLAFADRVSRDNSR